MTLFEEISTETPPKESEDVLKKVAAKFGMIPNVARVLAANPGTLKAYLAMREALGDTPIDAADGEAIALAISAVNGCDYCISAHSGAARRYGSDTAEIERNLKGQAEDPRRDALVRLAKRMMEQAGALSEEEITSLREAGLSIQDFVAVAGWLAVNTLTNTVNRLARTEHDLGQEKQA